MTRLHAQEIEKLLEECMPLYQARCKRLADGSFAFQFKSRSNSADFSIVGIRATECSSHEQVRRLGQAFLEDLAMAQTAALAPRAPASQLPSRAGKPSSGD